MVSAQAKCARAGISTSDGRHRGKGKAIVSSDSSLSGRKQKRQIETSRRFNPREQFGLRRRTAKAGHDALHRLSKNVPSDRRSPNGRAEKRVKSCLLSIDKHGKVSMERPETKRLVKVR